MQLVNIDEPNIGTSASEDVAVGIDFGTTNSLIAFFDGKSTHIIKMPSGSCLLPSVLRKVNNRIVVQDDFNTAKEGNISKEGNIEINIQASAGDKITDSIKKPSGNSINKPHISTGIIRSIKRLLGKDSSEIKNDPSLYMLSDILNLDDHLPTLQDGDLNISMAEAASKIIQYLKLQAEHTLKKPVTKAVISVPAHFNDAERGQVLLAAKLAQLDVLRLIVEPTSAACAHGLTTADKGSFLVYDLGGGTFDVSILNMQKGVLQVVATAGDNMLGGDDLDMLLAKYLADKYNLTLNHELLTQAKYIKESLSNTKETTLSIDNQKISITYEEYDSIIAPIIDKTMKIVKNALYDIDNITIDGVICVGGSTRIPTIQQRLKTSLKAPLYNLDPDKIVAIGAAIQAYNLSTPYSSSSSASVLVDVVPLSLGLELYGGIVEKIILRNTPIPFSVTKEFTTYADHQTAMQFHILQGERETVEDCRSLAHFEFKNLPSTTAGKVKVYVTFSIDIDNILSVMVRDSHSNQTCNIQLKPTYGLDQASINKMLEEAFLNAASDHEKKLLLIAREKAADLIIKLNQAIKKMPDVIEPDELNHIKEQIDQLELCVESTSSKKISDQIDRLNLVANNFIQKYLNKGLDLHLKNKHIGQIGKNNQNTHNNHNHNNK